MSLDPSINPKQVPDLNRLVNSEEEMMQLLGSVEDNPEILDKTITSLKQGLRDHIESAIDAPNLTMAGLSKLATLNPSQPNLVQAGNFNLSAVVEELKGNPWFNTMFITTLTMNLLELVKAQKDIKRTEGNLYATMLKSIMDTAKLIGDLIFKKAEKEASMHTQMAIAGMVAFGIGMLGAGMSIGAGFRNAGATRNIEMGKSQMKEAGMAMKSSNSDVMRQGQMHFQGGKTQMAKGFATQRGLATNSLAFGGNVLNPMQASMLGHIAENLIQANMKKQIAKVEQEIEMERARKENMARMFDASMKTAGDAAEIINSILQHLRNIQDANTQAFNQKT